jgi:putative ABC transport system permease protein
MSKWIRRLQYWVRGRRMDAELQEELEFHRAARQQALEASGLSPERAAYEARRDLGNTALAREDARAVWIWPWFESAWQDLRNAARALRREPSFAIVVAVTLALGVGLNATVFGLMDALLLRPFQFPGYERIVVLREARKGAAERESVAPATFLDWRSQARSFETLGAWEGWGVNLTGRGEAERLQGARVTAGFFELLSVTPALGYPLAIDERHGAGDRRVMLSDALWKRRFGGDPGIVGREILLDGETYVVAAVAPPRFEFPVACEIWAPLGLTPQYAADRTRRTLTAIGKLAAGTSVRSAQAELEAIGARLSTLYPASHRDRVAMVEPISSAFREAITPAIVGILQAAGALVLIVACANLVGLLLARGIDRRRELAMRAALGAGRMRLVRQLVTETVLLALLSSALALLVARMGMDVLRATMPAEAARYTEGWYNLRLDIRLVLATPALAIVVGALVGLVPALSACRGNLTDVLKGGDRGSVRGIGRPRARQALVAAEIAFALAGLVAAGLIIESGTRLAAQPGGFEPHDLVVLEISVPENDYASPGARHDLADGLLARLRATPGVQTAAVSSILPAMGWSPSARIVAEGRPDRNDTATPPAGFQLVSPGYFGAMRIPVLSGREFSTLDREDSEPVAIVSETLARRFWLGESALGRRVRPSDGEVWHTVVGVVKDVTMYNWWDGVDYQRVYVPLRQGAPDGVLYAAARAGGDAAAVTPSLRTSVRSIDRRLPIQRVRTMQSAIEETSLGLNFLAVLMAICGGIAGLLATVGIYGMMAYSVSARMHEFGLRMALGGTGRDVLRLALMQAGRVTAAGMAAGSLVALLFGWALQSALFGIVSIQGTTFAVAAGGLALVSFVAAYLPARKTERLDPAAVLRG